LLLPFTFLGLFTYHKKRSLFALSLYKNLYSILMALVRKKIISANWKMHITASQVLPYLTVFLSEMTVMEAVEVILIPPFTSLPKASEIVQATSHARTFPLRLGAQNISSHEKGAFTGEIAAMMLCDLKVDCVLIGHSERRQLFGETNKIIHEKMMRAHDHHLSPILCVGETWDERSLGKEKQILEQQLREALCDLSRDQIARTIIAYEPVWAIGTGQTASLDQAEEMHSFIRGMISECSDETTAQHIRIQYGGSVTPLNAKEMLSGPNIDGALVGGASLDPHSFAEIVKHARNAQRKGSF
jgi:triosephosphate isomerase